jgi:hypothetical protein
MKSRITQVICMVLSITWLIGLGSCANMIPPGGGPRDSLAPVLVRASPEYGAKNVSPHKLVLEFDEFITLDNAFTNLIVSPALKTQPPATSKLRELTVVIKDTLDPNTTYTFDFGNAIKDVNEGNIAKDLMYVFSTGSSIDTNTYHGKVMMAETGKTDSANIFVILHRDLSDSAVYKIPPRYYTRVNGKGEFQFTFLPAGAFAVYVIDRKSFMKTYSDSSFLFAFRNSPVSVSTSTGYDTLYAYQAYKKDASSSGVTNPVKAPNRDDKRLRYSIELDNGTQDLLTDLHLNFQRKLTSFDSSKIGLYDTSYRLLTGYAVSIDSSRTKISLRYPWKQFTPYRLLIAKDAVADSTGTTLSKADTLRFSTKKETDYGSIRLRFTNLDLSRHPVLQFVVSDRVVDSFPITQPEFYRKMYLPGSYNLRILYDTNNNGKWDPGQFLPNKRQPEVIILINRQLSVRGNWDNETNIVL